MMMPHVFDWLVPEQLGACVNPAVGEQVTAQLRSGGITLLINLHERPDPPDLLALLGAEELHMPVPDSNPPTQEQLDRGVSAIVDALARGARVAVHCGAGLGRTGTLLAAYLVSRGSDPDDAIARIREVRPGSVETLEQEQAVHEFARRHIATRLAEG
jgi:atypical dual specificity phosphatase